MKALLNAMRMQARLESAARITKQMAVVSSYDPDNYAAKVTLLPNQIETGWLPVASPWVGNGWGMFAPPTQGDLVDVHFVDDDRSAGYVSQRLFTNSARPLAVQSGEFWLVHQSGSLLKFHNDGSVELTAAAGLVIKAASIKLQNAGTALLNLLNSAFATWAQNHVHTSAAPGSPTSAPTVAPAANTQTSIVQAE